MQFHFMFTYSKQYQLKGKLIKKQISTYYKELFFNHYIIEITVNYNFKTLKTKIQI